MSKSSLLIFIFVLLFDSNPCSAMINESKILADLDFGSAPISTWEKGRVYGERTSYLTTAENLKLLRIPVQSIKNTYSNGRLISILAMIGPHDGLESIDEIFQDALNTLRIDAGDEDSQIGSSAEWRGSSLIIRLYPADEDDIVFISIDNIQTNVVEKSQDKTANVVEKSQDKTGYSFFKIKLHKSTDGVYGPSVLDADGFKYQHSKCQDYVGNPSPGGWLELPEGINKHSDHPLKSYLEHYYSFLSEKIPYKICTKFFISNNESFKDVETKDLGPLNTIYIRITIRSQEHVPIVVEALTKKFGNPLEFDMTEKFTTFRGEKLEKPVIFARQDYIWENSSGDVILVTTNGDFIYLGKKDLLEFFASSIETKRLNAKDRLNNARKNLDDL